MKKRRAKDPSSFIKDHLLVPKHVKVSEKEKKALLAQYNIAVRDLPKINIHDPAIHDLNVQSGDIIKIMRTSATAGDIVFYRGVVDE
ncbi:MAG: DNA-directed RNA polymerase subunit H [archaeon]